VRHQRQDRLPGGRRQTRAWRGLAPGQHHPQPLEASYALEDGQVIPTLRRRAHMSAELTLLMEEGAPFAWGIPL
jgi:hypothetical protein